MATVVVFGGTGFLGRRIVRRLAEEGATVRGAVRNPSQARGTLGVPDSARITFLRADVRDPASVAAAVSGADAAVNAVSAYVERGGVTFEAVHERGAETVARAVAVAGISRLMLVSGIGADPNSPSPYIHARGRGERAGPAGVPNVTIVRPAAMFGPSGVYQRTRRPCSPIPDIAADRRGTRSQPAYVQDVAEAIARIYGRRGRLPGLTSLPARLCTRCVSWPRWSCAWSKDGECSCPCLSAWPSFKRAYSSSCRTRRSQPGRWTSSRWTMWRAGCCQGSMTSASNRDRSRKSCRPISARRAPRNRTRRCGGRDYARRWLARNSRSRSEAGARKKRSGGPSSSMAPRCRKIVAARDLARETHLVRDHQHRAAFLGEAAHHAQHLAHQFGIERRGRLVEQHTLGCIASARAMAARCCCPPERCAG